jgi:hypothetical protein
MKGWWPGAKMPANSLKPQSCTAINIIARHILFNLWIFSFQSVLFLHRKGWMQNKIKKKQRKTGLKRKKHLLGVTSKELFNSRWQHQVLRYYVLILSINDNTVLPNLCQILTNQIKQFS